MTATLITKPLGEPIETEEQAKNWFLELVAEVERIRRMCDLALAVKDATAAYHRWLIYYGQGLGALVAMQRCGKISDGAYTELRQRLLATTIPTVKSLETEILINSR